MNLLVGIKHELLGYGLIQLIKDVKPVSTMAVASTDEELLQTLKKYEFDLIVVHANLPGKGGFRSLFAALEKQPETCRKVIIFTEPECELNEQFKSGIVDGLFHEQSSLDELMLFFYRIVSGEQAILHFYGHITEEDSQIGEDLSKREEEIFNMKVRGYTVKDTAKLLNISEKTVENHRRNIKKKLNIRKNHEWFEWGKKFGVV